MNPEQLDPQQTPTDFIAHALNAIHTAPIVQEPFPHFVINGFFPDDVYQELMQRIGKNIDFEKAIYPGTSVDMDADAYKDYGMIASAVESDDLLRDVYAFLRSEQFTRALLDKFSALGSRMPDGTAIPEEKHRFFKNSNDYSSVFDLHLDLPGYEIPPHPDHPSKIVTFLFYLPKDESLANYGTHLCKPKPGVVPSKPKTGALEKLLSLFSGRFGLGQRSEWYEWKDFDIVKTAQAVPNTFLSFAPNEISYHAVRLNAPSSLEAKGRTVIRGFIRSGSNKSNYLSGYSDKFGRKAALGLIRMFSRPKNNP